MLITGSLNLYYVFQNQQKTVAAQQELIAQNAANSVRNFVQGNFDRLESAVRLGGLASATRPEQKRTLEKLLGLEPAFRQVLLLDSQERELLKVSRLSNLAMTHLGNLGCKNLALQLKQQKIFISSIFIDEASSEPLLWMAVPITDIFGDAHGIVAAEVNLKFMWDFVGNIKAGNSGRAYVVDKKGNLLAFRDVSRVLKGENLSHFAEVAKFVNNDELHVGSNAEISKGIQGTYVVSNHVPLGVPDWAVVVELPVHEAYQTLIRTFVILGLAMVLSLCLTIIVGIFLSKRITQPIVAFRNATKKIGVGDFSARIGIESRNEIGELAQSFNTMVNNLNTITVSRDALEKEVAERTLAEIALRESEERFRAIFQGSSDALMLLTEKGFFDCNPATLEMFGFANVGEFSKIHPADISPATQPDGTESFPAALERIKTAYEKGCNRFEWVHRRTSGEDFFAEVLLTAFDMNGKRVLQATVRDITHRKQAELALRHREAMLSSIYMAAPVGIAVSSKRIVVAINRQITEISGYTAEELVGKSARIFFADQGEFERAGRELYTNLSLKGRTSIESRWKRKNGFQNDVLLTASSIEGTDQAIITIMDITERKQAELALQKSEEKYRSLIETTDTGFLILDNRGRVLDANREYVRLSGHAELSEILGRSVIEWTAENCRQRNAEAVARCIKDGLIRNLVLEYVNKSEGTIPVEINATVNGDGEKMRIVSLCRDITERKRAEEALRKSEAMLRGVYLAAPVGITVSNKRVIESVNGWFSKMSGFSVEEMVGKNARIYFPDDAEYERVGRELYGKGGNVEARLQRKDGMLFDVLLSIATLDPHDPSAGNVVTALDITERKRAERSLAESEKSFRSMFELTSEGVALISPKTKRFIAANPAMCAMFGYTEEEFCALSGEDITAPEAKETMRQATKVLLDGGNVPDHEGISLRKDGSFVNAIVSCRQMSWKGEQVFYVTFKDVTFLKAIQDRLKKKNSEILEFTDMVTHDLRKPLTTMNIVLGMAQKGAFGQLGPDGVVAVDTGLEASHYMQEMLEDLLACARFESGTQEFVIEEMHLRDLVDSVLTRLKYQIEDKKIRVIPPDMDVVIHADRKQFIRILMNLVGNAINYIGGGPDKFIRISWERTNGTPVFLVADNGIGIPNESKREVFSKFKRGNNVSGIQGTGLGLSIVKGIVEAHGGNMWFESEVGKGTTLYFTLGSAKANA